MIQREAGPGRLVVAVTTVLGVAVIIAGLWAMVAPSSFADLAGFAGQGHFVADTGAFQLGLGVGLLLAPAWADSLATVLAGFLVATTAHAVNHIVDLDEGAAAWQAWLLGGTCVAVAAALYLRLREIGYVVGRVSTAATGELARLLRQKTVVLTTYRRDGTPGRTPVSIAVEGEHAYLRSFEKALKTRRLARDPKAEVAPSDGLGRTIAGPAVAGRVRRLDGARARHAASVLRRKYPLLHGLLVPAAHRVLRARTGRTVHFEFTPR
ncbi:PPOX class probable F420-dependent enzyme [Saccharomonospora amisosensis]|uniref:PPOX class probable F420-dependent enzyme n=1 Tax=Saccharomonospora amisosensis TaxID=1128677 RepID=A0A7X5UQN2_9PSEU|nr:PPOX class F420-dependent oxidoreductase [Saccharomonospora amisosensis]NIJ12360.1 PPOX class probable F420-dependent enzyme [Saccharomonospora amisosensis]